MAEFEIDRKKFDTLIEINALINSEFTDVKTLLDTIIESATRLIDAEASSLILVNPENQKLYFEIALGPKGPEVKRFSLKIGEGIAGWVAQNNRPLVVNDVHNDERFLVDISKKIGYPTQSILAVPMRLKGTCVGVVEIINKQNGAFDDADLQWMEIFATQAAIAIQNARSYQKAQEQIVVLHDHIQAGQGFHTFIGESRQIVDKLEIAKRAAQTDSSVLLLGESGVGKELFAEQIHLNSPRRDAPFIRVNCAALPEHLLESELFGHVKGAFTDATADRRGRFELADEGTIFLDEIGDVPLNLQGKLLRVIQRKTFERVGSSESISVNVRIIAATNKDIERLVETKQFRTDLYYRLNVLPIHIPPLRDRREDIPHLIDYFLNRFNREVKKQIHGITEESMALLLSHSWPGNIRELENAIERAVVITKDEYIKPEAFILGSDPRVEEEAYSDQTLKDAVNIFKKHFIRKALESNGWQQTKTAQMIGIQRTYLSKLIRDLQIVR